MSDMMYVPTHLFVNVKYLDSVQISFTCSNIYVIYFSMKGSEEAITLQMVGRKRVNKSLWQLAREGDLKEIESQLESNGDFQNNIRINQLDSKNLSPLHYACKYLRLDTIKLLISNGANVNIHGEDNM